MKMRKIFCLVLAVILVVPFLASCGKQKFTETFTVIFREPKDEYADMTTEQIKELADAGKTDEELYDYCFKDENVKFTGTDEQFTVLNVVEFALQNQEVDYDLSKDQNSVSNVFGHQDKDSVDSEKGYYSYWYCTINGSASADGRQSTTPVQGGDVIVYTWTSSYQNRQDTQAVDTTDPNEDTTGNFPVEETTVDEENIDD